MAAAYDEALIELSEERGGRMLIATAAPGEPVEEALRALLSQPAAALFVGTFDEAVVGGAVVEALDTTVGRVACIRLLFVAEAARGVGVGERLMEEVTNWSTDYGCVGIDAPALPGMRDTKNFFEGAGFKARLLVMHRPLAGPGPTAV